MFFLSRISLIAFFGAGSLYLSSIEYLLPRPMPFFRFGLANIAVLLIIKDFLFRDAFIVVILKVIGLGIINGTIVSYVFVFSFLGSIAGFLSMWACKEILQDKVSLIGMSMIGASISNIVQITAAVFFVFGRSAWIIAPYLFVLGAVSGLFVGMMAQYFSLRSQIVHALRKRYKNSLQVVEKEKREKVEKNITLETQNEQKKSTYAYDAWRAFFYPLHAYEQCKYTICANGSFLFIGENN